MLLLYIWKTPLLNKVVHVACGWPLRNPQFRQRNWTKFKAIELDWELITESEKRTSLVSGEMKSIELLKKIDLLQMWCHYICNGSSNVKQSQIALKQQLSKIWVFFANFFRTETRRLETKKCTIFNQKAKKPAG